MNKRIIRILAIVLAISMIPVLAVSAAAPVVLPGQTSCFQEEIYPGVIATEYVLAEGYTYSENGPQWLRTIEFDPKQEDLAVDVVFPEANLGALKRTSQMVQEFNANNTENKKAIVGINGDLWLMKQYQSRVEGESSDPVVKKELTIPRGTNIVDGEIICGQHINQETPWEETFQSFGIAADGTPLIGNLNVRMTMTDTAAGVSRLRVDGFNRLPADKAIIVYSDKGPLSNYCLDDAYEIVIDCDYDYIVRHGETITGTVTEISTPGSTRPMMKENRLIITARGTDKIASVSGIGIGDTVSVAVSMSDSYGNSEQWRTVSDAVGGHVTALKDGQSFATSIYRYDPMTLIGFKEDGHVMIIINDGRQPGYSIGIVRGLYDELALELGLSWVFMLDGGGSTTLVELTEQGYEIKNRPSDTDFFGRSVERAVDNALILSYIMEPGEEPDPDPDPEPEPEPEPTVILGDINNDEVVNAIDSNIMKKALGGQLTLEEAQLKAADVNADGSFNAIDANLMKKFLGGTISSFE